MRFSEEFKSLFNSLVAYDPSHRPSLCEILFHPWVRKGRIATPDQIFDEFPKRKTKVAEEKLQEEIEAKKSQDQMETKMAESNLVTKESSKKMEEGCKTTDQFEF